MRAASTLAMLAMAAAGARAAASHAAQGLVLKIDARHRAVLVSCDAIPGYMAAMEMPLRVKDAASLKQLQAGEVVRFEMVEQGKKVFAENIRPVMNFEAEPAEAEALMGLRRATDPNLRGRVVQVGQAVPDFTLTDQVGLRVSLSEFRGKVVALTFGYSRCPNPDYCYRLSNNLGKVAKRLHARPGGDLVLMTIAIDPEYDRGEALTQYADRYHADARVWHFLTGPVAQIRQVAATFGMDFWVTDGLLTHTLHTVVIGRDGRLAANIEGNAFSAEQLGDLVLATMGAPAHAGLHETAPIQ